MHPPVVKNMVFCDFCHVQFSITCGLNPDLSDITGIKHMVPNQAFGKLYGIDMGTLLAFPVQPDCRSDRAWRLHRPVVYGPFYCGYLMSFPVMKLYLNVNEE